MRSLQNIKRSVERALPQATVRTQYLANRYLHGVQVSDSPVFIVGCGHSGTSLLLAMIGAHPNIFAIPEESRIGFEEDPIPISRRFEVRAIAAGKTRWVEKTPKHIRRIGILLDTFPHAKVLLIIRDGRDVACSIRDRNGSIEKGIARWIEDNQAGRGFWDNTSVHCLKYEDLITNPEATLRGVFEFLGEPFDRRVLEYHSDPKYFYSDVIERPDSPQGENHNQYRNWQINQPLFDGRGKWKSLCESEKQLIREVGNDLLIELGYVDSDRW